MVSIWKVIQPGNRRISSYFLQCISLSSGNGAGESVGGGGISLWSVSALWLCSLWAVLLSPCSFLSDRWQCHLASFSMLFSVADWYLWCVSNSEVVARLMVVCISVMLARMPFSILVATNMRWSLRIMMKSLSELERNSLKTSPTSEQLRLGAIHLRWTLSPLRVRWCWRHDKRKLASVCRLR